MKFRRRIIPQTLGAGLLVITAVGMTMFSGFAYDNRPQEFVIDFARGATPAADSETIVAAAVEVLEANGSYRVWITGHTSANGAETALLTLSEQRAERVAALLIAEGVDESRIAEIIGAGGAEALPQNFGESNRAYERRMGRVTVEVEAR